MHAGVPRDYLLPCPFNDNRSCRAMELNVLKVVGQRLFNVRVSQCWTPHSGRNSPPARQRPSVLQVASPHLRSNVSPGQRRVCTRGKTSETPVTPAVPRLRLQRLVTKRDDGDTGVMECLSQDLETRVWLRSSVVMFGDGSSSHPKHNL